MRSIGDILRHPFVRKHISQGWKFAVVGITGMTFDLGILTILHDSFNVSVPVANTCSVAVAVTVVFFLNKYFTFKDPRKNHMSQGLKFALVYGVAVISNILISSGLFWIGVQYQLAKIVAIGIGAIWNYTLSQGFVFKKKEPTDAVIV